MVGVMRSRGSGFSPPVMKDGIWKLKPKAARRASRTWARSTTTTSPACSAASSFAAAAS